MKVLRYALHCLTDESNRWLVLYAGCCALLLGFLIGWTLYCIS